MNALVVGHGSIGARHARILKDEGCAVGVVSGRLGPAVRFKTLADGLKQHDPLYVVVANRTADHKSTIHALAAAGYTGRVLVEKPLFSSLSPLPTHQFQSLHVAYNLRFHPVLRALHGAIEGHRVLSVQAYAGQYLPDWRTGRDYRDSYSADRAQGGGVLRDLSHEFDYLGWLLGPWIRATALGGHLSTLEIDSEDVAVVLAAYTACPAVSVHLNYLDRPGRRRVVVNTDEATFEADIVRGTLHCGEHAKVFSSDRDYTYRAQHRALLNGEGDSACTADEALDTLALVEAAEISLVHPQWVVR